MPHDHDLARPCVPSGRLFEGLCTTVNLACRRKPTHLCFSCSQHRRARESEEEGEGEERRRPSVSPRASRSPCRGSSSSHWDRSLEMESYSLRQGPATLSWQLERLAWPNDPKPPKPKTCKARDPEQTSRRGWLSRSAICRRLAGICPWLSSHAANERY